MTTVRTIVLKDFDSETYPQRVIRSARLTDMRNRKEKTVKRTVKIMNRERVVRAMYPCKYRGHDVLVDAVTGQVYQDNTCFSSDQLEIES